MKKTIIFIAMAALCLFFNARSQSVVPLGRRVKPLLIGDRMPELRFGRVLNYGDSLSFADFRGKAIILDFWATWCGGCIKNMPHAMAIQKRYGDRLQVITVNNSGSDDLGKIRAFLEKNKGTKYELTLPILYQELILNELCPKKVIPHYVWIGADRRVKAITYVEELTEENLERLIAGLSLNVRVKGD